MAILFCYSLCSLYLCSAFRAQMAESVDALVSNTSGATRAGSTPALGTRLKSKRAARMSMQHVFYVRS